MVSNNNKEYLKKYLSGPAALKHDNKKSSKELKNVKKGNTLFIDDDAEDWIQEKNIESKTVFCNPIVTGNIQSFKASAVNTTWKKVTESSADAVINNSLDVLSNPEGSKTTQLSKQTSTSHDLKKNFEAHSDSDISPPRKSSAVDDDLSPVRKQRRRVECSSRDLKSGRMADGTKTGLLTSKEIKEINALKRAREKNSTFSERESQTTKAVIRDKTGKRIDPELIREQKKIEEEKEKERMVKYQQWSAGTTQLKLRQEKLKEEEHEAKKAFTRYRSDEDLDKYYRNRARADDPMARFLNKKKDQDKPVYKGPLPPTNRYGILPGYRWDGVDRSNGFEKKLMEAQANRLSRAAEVYTWSTEDM